MLPRSTYICLLFHVTNQYILLFNKEALRPPGPNASLFFSWEGCLQNLVERLGVYYYRGRFRTFLCSQEIKLCNLAFCTSGLAR